MQDVPRQLPTRVGGQSPQTKDVFLMNDIDLSGHRRIVRWRLHGSVNGGYERCKKACKSKFKFILRNVEESFEFLYIRAQQN